MPPKTITMLGSLTTAELSLVRRGANDRRFAVTKGMDMDLQEVLQSVLATEAEGEKALTQTLKSAGLDEDGIGVAIAQYRLQHGFKDKVSKDAFAAVAKAAGYHDVKKTEPAPKPEPRSKTPADMPPELEAVWKSQQEAITAANERSEKLERQLEQVRKDALRKDYVAKCEREFAHVPGMTAEQMADMLIQAESVSKEFAEGLQKQWSATAEAVKKSGLLRASGSTGPRSTSGDAWSQMQAMAKELVQKSAGELTSAKALDKVVAENPDLYQEYLNQNPAQLGKR